MTRALSAVLVLIGLHLSGVSDQIIIRNANDCDNVPSPCAPFNGSDEFNGSSINTANWVIMDRGGDESNSEAQCFKPAQQSMTGGEFLITVQVVSSHTCSGVSYTRDSAMIQWKTFNFTYGTVEARAKLTGGQGPWPLIWFLGANCQATNVISADNSPPCSWPDPGSDEIDFVEVLGGSTTAINQQIHSNGHNDGCTGGVADTRVYHTYQMIWSAGSLVWKIDGSTTCTVSANVPSTPMFLLLSVALGGVGGGSINNGTLPQTMTVDYVRVTQP